MAARARTRQERRREEERHPPPAAPSPIPQRDRGTLPAGPGNAVLARAAARGEPLPSDVAVRRQSTHGNAAVARATTATAPAGRGASVPPIAPPPGPPLSPPPAAAGETAAAPRPLTPEPPRETAEASGARGRAREPRLGAATAAPPVAGRPSGAGGAPGGPPAPLPRGAAIAPGGQPSQIVAQLGEISPVRVPFVFASVATAVRGSLATRRGAEAGDPPRALVQPRPPGGGHRGAAPAPARLPGKAEAALRQAGGPPPAREKVGTPEHTGSSPEVRGVEDPARQLDRMESDDEGIFAWVRRWLQRLLAAVPTSDSGVSVAPGAAPRIDLAGTNYPAQVGSLRTSGTASLDARWVEAEQARTADSGVDAIAPAAGEEEVFAGPHENRAPERPSCSPAEHAEPLAFDPDDEAELWARVRDEQDQALENPRVRMAEAERRRDEQIASARTEGAASIAALHTTAYGEQEAAVGRAHDDVERQQRAWDKENRALLASYGTQAERLATQTEGDVEDFRTREEGEIAGRYQRTEERARAERQRVEEQARQAREETERESEGWFSRGIRWLKGKVSEAFAWLTEKVRGWFEELRRTVAQWFEDLAAWASEKIDQARQWVVGKLEEFRTDLKALVDEHLGQFPVLAGIFKTGIDVAVDTAQGAVDVAAEGLKIGVNAVLDGIAATVDGALRVAEFFAEETLELLCGLTVTGFNLILVAVNRDLDSVIELVRDLPEPALLGPLWPLVKACLLGFLERLRAKPADEKKRFLKKILSLAISPSYHGGYVLGVIKGFVWEGLLGLVRLIWDLVKFIPTAVREIYAFFRRLLTDTETIERIVAAAGEVGQALAAFFERSDAVEQIMAFLQRSPLVLFEMVRQALAAGRGVARRIGAAMADALFKLVLESSPYEIGLALGSIAGQILFEVLAAIFTAGISLAVKAGGKIVQMILKGIRWLVGGLMKGGRLILDAFRALSGVVHAGFQAARRLSDALGGVLAKLKTLVDEIVEWFVRGFNAASSLVRRFIEKVRKLAQEIFEGLGFRRFDIDSEGEWLVLYGIRSKIMLARLRKDSLKEFFHDPTKLIEKLRKERDRLLRLTRKLAAEGDEAAATTLRSGKAAQTSADIGERAADRIIRQRFPSARRLHRGSGRNDLDLVYRLNDGTLVIVEAKGGAGRLATRTLPSGVQVQQGTVAYLRDILRVMKKSPEKQAMAEDVLSALNRGRIRYFLSETPLEAGSATLTTRLQEFRPR